MLIVILDQRDGSEGDVQPLGPGPGGHSDVQLDGGGLGPVHVRVGVWHNRFNMDCGEEITAILMFWIKLYVSHPRK